MQFPIVFFTAVVTSLVMPAVHGWWDTGHMLTAAVALKHLSPSKRKEAADLLTHLPGYTSFASDFVSASHWADDIKRNHDAYAFSSWHFIDFAYPNRSSCAQDTVEKQNIVVALEDMRSNLKNATLAGWNRAFSLRFTLHLMGDMHQPLHTTSRCTAQHPKGDAGGNLFKLNNSDYTNLHKFWDAMGGAYKETIAALCPYSNAKQCEANEPKRVEAVKQEADALMLEYPKDSFGADELNVDRTVFDKDVFMKWAASSYNIVKLGRVYGDVEEHGEPTKSYTEYVQTTTKRRVVLGGLRLAVLLNANLAVSEETASGESGESGERGGLIIVVVLLTIVSLLLGVAVLALVAKSRRRRPTDKSSTGTFEML